MIDDITIKKMSDAICLHLSYLESVSRTKLLAESSIRYPLLEYVERRDVNLDPLLEYKHEVFKRRRCDLLITDRGGDKSIFEFKYVRDDSHTEFQDYLDDLIRLYYMSKRGCKAYFVVCGNTLAFNKEFRNTKAVTTRLGSRRGRPSGLFAKCLSFNINNTDKNVSTMHFKENYKTFCGDYKFKNPADSHPASLNFRTRLVSLRYGDGVQFIGLWEVLS